jgi:predicted AAA+ superfamily ATPase
MFLKSRYDILLDKSGTEIIIPEKNHIVVYGGRKSGKTAYLVQDMLKQISKEEKIGFFSITMEHYRQIKKSILNPGNILHVDLTIRLVGAFILIVYIWMNFRLQKI